jgi:acetyltransferase
VTVSTERHYLTPLFAPRSVAIVGASERPGTAGRVLMENLLAEQFEGAVYPVNPKHAQVLGRPCFGSLDEVSASVDLAVVAAPAAAIPEIVAACARKGIRAALIVSDGLSPAYPQGPRLLRQTLAAARSGGVRILGPACPGILRPAARINLTYSRFRALPGTIALVSQSGALTNAILDWAQADGVGFSSVVTVGDGADVGFGEILDYLAWDVATESILLYLEGVFAPRRFVSALRMAARAKPVIVVKTGRCPAAYQAALTHSGALVGSDDVFDAVLRRAGAVRVKTFSQLFSAAKCLSARYRPTGNRLAIVTNGGGAGVIAADWAAGIGIDVPALAPATLERLAAALPAGWSRGNPLDLTGEATEEHYRGAVRACLEDAGIDGVLVILTPHVNTRAARVAEAVAETARDFRKPAVGCWMGGEDVEEGRRILSHARLPVFRTPEPAVEAFSHIATHYRNQQLLVQVPYSTSRVDRPDAEGARMVIEHALAEKRKVLSEMESKSLLAAFRIPVARTVVARSLPEAIMVAEQMGFPLAMKINSPDIPHKSDVGGVKLNIATVQQLRSAFNEIMGSVAARLPDARIDGVTLQPMTVKPNGRELMVGIATDPVFGPVITFAAGGIAAEVMGDRAVSLPPLNALLAKDLIERTRVARMLGPFRNLPAIHMDALVTVLMRVSEMASELPWIREMDINPLIVDEEGAIAVDARVTVDHATPGPGTRYAHMAICPYPVHLIQRWNLADGTEITIRPIRPEDAELLQAFVRNLSEESRYFRFISTVQELSPRTVARLTQIDYDREMALIAVLAEGEREMELGAARYVTNPDGETCEFALVVADAWQGRGIGTKLMHSLMEVARANGLKAMVGDVLVGNANMLRLMEKLGFAIENHPEDPSLKRVRKAL